MEAILNMDSPTSVYQEFKTGISAKLLKTSSILLDFLDIAQLSSCCSNFPCGCHILYVDRFFSWCYTIFLDIAWVFLNMLCCSNFLMFLELSPSCSKFFQMLLKFFSMLLKTFLDVVLYFFMLLECCPTLLDFSCWWLDVLYVAGILFHIAWIFLMLLDFLFVCFKILLQYSRITFNSVGDKLKTPLQYSRITFNLVGEKLKTLLQYSRVAFNAVGEKLKILLEVWKCKRVEKI